MNIRILTEAEARAIFENDAPELPIRSINDAGRAAVNAFVARNAPNPAQHNLGAWYAEAEDAANNAHPGEAIILEMPSRMTRSRNPETVCLADECFDWTILE